MTRAGSRAGSARPVVTSRDTKAPDAPLARQVLDRAREKGLILLTCGPHKNVVRLLPPLVTSLDEAERALRILDEAGISEPVIGAGRKLTKVAYYEGRERRAEIDYSRLASRHPYLLVVRQSLLERAAEEALRKERLPVLWGHRLQSLTADGAAVRVEVAKLDQVAKPEFQMMIVAREFRLPQWRHARLTSPIAIAVSTQPPTNA